MHDDLDQSDAIGIGKRLVLQELVQLLLGLHPVILLLALVRIVFVALCVGVELFVAEKVEQQTMVVGRNIIVTALGAVDLALNFVAVVVEDEEVRAETVFDHGADLLDRELERTVADKQVGAS